ncbi:MAG TPA: winged helix-turn-helix transcriptional regulator [Thermoplasmata archaeon]|nr:winged helix-turn-helix transcriptional regulator [Thermoplasmata archaeon]
MRGLAGGVAAILVMLLLPAASAPALDGSVVDLYTGRGIANAQLTLYFPDSDEPLTDATTDANGSYRFPDIAAGDYRLHVRAETYFPTNVTVSVGPDGTASRDVTLRPIPAPGAALGESPIAMLSLVLLILAAVLLGGLFARIQRGQMLQNVVRLRIYEHIRANPGNHYRSILSTLGLAMGVLSYHLNTLERGGYITSRQDGTYRRFYPMGTKTEVALFLSDIQKRIVLALRQNVGITQGKLAASVGISRPLTHYHLRVLRDAGLVRFERRGRETECYLVEDGPSLA